MKKIKKYAIYTLILIMLVGIFSPTMIVHGAPLPGDPNFIGPSAPTTFFCQPIPQNPKFQDLLAYATCIISTSVIPLIFALALVSFIWGVVQYVINSDEEAKKAKGRQFMIWGIIALTVMVSVWGLVAILGNTFGIKSVIPQVAVPK